MLWTDPAGWDEIRQGNRYSAWFYQIKIHIHDCATGRDPAFPRRRQIGIADLSWLNLNRSASVLMKSILFGDDPFADWLGRRLVHALATDERLVPRKEWLVGPFEPSAVKLFALWKGIDLTLTSEQWAVIGPWQPLFEHWTDADISDIVRDLCDFHCRFSRRIRRECEPEGLDIPFRDRGEEIFPFEILALYRIRRDLGLSVPDVRHPLLDQPLGHPPETFPPLAPDPLLEEAIAVSNTGQWTFESLWR